MTYISPRRWIVGCLAERARTARPLGNKDGRPTRAHCRVLRSAFLNPKVMISLPCGLIVYLDFLNHRKIRAFVPRPKRRALNILAHSVATRTEKV